jgi:hypothetical protein
MRDLARHIDRTMHDAGGRRMGFALLVFDFASPSLSHYISNTVRRDMIATLRDAADRLEQGEEIPPGIGTA